MFIYSYYVVVLYTITLFYTWNKSHKNQDNINLKKKKLIDLNITSVCNNSSKHRVKKCVARLQGNEHEISVKN